MGELKTTGEFDALPDGAVLVRNPTDPDSRDALIKSAGMFRSTGYKALVRAADEMADKCRWGDTFLVVWLP